MKRSLVFAACLLYLYLLVGVCPAQVAIGTPLFGSFGGGPFDTVDLGNLNIHFVIPVVQKAGRGVSFNYNLVYDSAVWEPVTSNGTTSWTNNPDTNWGWTTSIPRGGHTAIGAESVSLSQCTTGKITEDIITTTYSNWGYFDGFGTRHPFSGSSSKTSNPCTGVTTTTGFTATALDDSGYTITVNGSSVTSLKASDGATINPITGAISLEDRNGNEVTSSTSSGVTTYTDTLGVTALVVSGSGTPSSPLTFSYPAPANGASSCNPITSCVAFTMNFVQYTVQTGFGVKTSGGATIAEFGPKSIALVDNIALPDGTEYNFTYEAGPSNCTLQSGTSKCVTARIASVTLPTGGVITYQYSGGPSSTGIYNDGSTAVLTRILSPSTSCSSGGCWQYSRKLVSGSTWNTLVTDPASNQSSIDFSDSLYETQRKTYQGSISTTSCSDTVTNNCLLLTSFRCYNANYSNCDTATVSNPITERDLYTQLLNGSTRLSRIQYNSGLVTDDQEFNYGVTTGAAPGTSHLVKETSISYGSFNGSGCTALGNNIVSTPCQVTVKDWTSGSAVTIASASYTYDGTTPTSTSGTPQHLSISGSRGNPTTIATLTSGSASLSRTISYYDTGTPNVATDVNGAQTTYVYGTSSCGNSFPTTINEPLSLSRSISWNCTGGVTTQVKDENGNNVTATYTDPDFWRPASTTDEMSNQTDINYFAQRAIESVLQNFNGGSSASDGRSTVDGFGRPILSQRLQAVGATNYDTTETDYNNIGLPQRNTMPFSATVGTTNSSAPATTNTYDALGRVLTIKDADGGTVSYTYNNNDILQKVSGTQSFQKQFEYDGLGRVTSICEITSATGNGPCGQSQSGSGFVTKYTYDALGHLLTVTQNAQAASANQQTRSFVYDLMGRMTSETNPESGTTTYVYDTESSCAGNVPFTSNGDLLQKNDANGNQICYFYDLLHRVGDIGNNHQGPSNPCKRFRYDNSSGYTGSTKPSGLVNTLGRLIEVATDRCDATGDTILSDEWFSYDKRGEVTDVYESTPHSGGYYHTTAAFWPTGLLKTLSGIPGVPALNYGANGPGLDGEGRITQVTASSGPNPVTSVTYSTSSNPNYLGALTGLTFGSADSDSFTYDSNTGRMLTYGFNVNGKTDSGSLTWNTNGTLAKLVVSDQISGTADSQTCTYGYDDLQRVSSVNCGTLWSQNFAYDGMGNISKSVPSGDAGGQFLPTYSTTPPTNRFTAIPGVTVNYDADGNLLADNLNTYTWNVYGNMATVSNGSTTVSATYDALGRMVEQQNGSTSTEILYSPMGKTALLNGQALVKAFVYLPGGATAVYNSSGLAYYRHSDWLGSSRLSSTQSRGLFSSSAYAPFGERYGTAGTADPSFTGQNSDTTSSLYDFLFREHSPSQGRWISPDPAGLAAVDPTNPQTWNRYAYVNNDPVNNIDPLGLEDPADTGGDGGIGIIYSGMWSGSWNVQTLISIQDQQFWGNLWFQFAGHNGLGSNELASVGSASNSSGQQIRVQNGVVMIYVPGGCTSTTSATAIPGGSGSVVEEGPQTCDDPTWIPLVSIPLGPALPAPISSLKIDISKPPMAQIGKPHLSRSQAQARCRLNAQLENNGFNSEGFHAPNPGRDLFPNQDPHLWSNYNLVLPTGSRPAARVNPSGSESGEGADSVALLGYFSAVSEYYTGCMEIYNSLVNSGSIGQ